MGQLTTLETKLGDLYKSAPALPKDAKKAIVEWWPVVALVLGVLQLAAAWSLWTLYDRYASPLVDYAQTIAAYTGVDVGYSSFDKLVIFVSIAFVVLSGVLMIMAYKPLKARAKRGWDLLFLGVLVSAVYAVLNIFIDGRGVGSFIFNLLGLAIGLYFLYQIRDAYTAK